MKEFLIKTILSWLAGITAEQWKSALNRVIALAATKDPGDAKRVRFNDYLQSIAFKLSPWAINLLRETAVAYARRKGLIK